MILLMRLNLDGSDEEYSFGIKRNEIHEFLYTLKQFARLAATLSSLYLTHT